MEWHHEGLRWWALFGGIFWLLLIGAIVYLIASVFASGHAHEHRHDHGEEDPLAIAKRRYAKGEISREEFEQIRKDLTGG